MYLTLFSLSSLSYSIDDDILNLVDGINVDEFVKEASIALEDEGMLREFIKEKATIAVERFLVRISRVSSRCRYIPCEHFLNIFLLSLPGLSSKNVDPCRKTRPRRRVDFNLSRCRWRRSDTDRVNNQGASFRSRIYHPDRRAKQISLLLIFF